MEPPLPSPGQGLAGLPVGVDTAVLRFLVDRAGWSGTFMVTGNGRSMLPWLRPGDVAVVRPRGRYRFGEIVAFARGSRLLIHRIVACRRGAAGASYRLKGDGLPRLDSGWVPQERIVGKVTGIRRAGITVYAESRWTRTRDVLLAAGSLGIGVLVALAQEPAIPAVEPSLMGDSYRDRCRLCGDETGRVFDRRVLGRYEVAYSRCTGCDSLQTEFPHWLDEVYSSTAPAVNLRAVARSLAVRRFVLRVLEVVSAAPAGSILDWGAGNGFLVRLLRDAGRDAYGYDRFVRPLYADERDIPAKVDIVTAFEVWEHFARPAEELARIFAFSPRVHLMSTELYRRQPPDWDYLHPEIGRHVFFYSARALELVAERFGYEVVAGDRFAVFVASPPGHRARRRLQALMRDPALPALP